MRKNYKPNFIPLKTRVWMLIGMVLLLLFTLAEFATGYTFLPGKRGGVLLSGIPTFMVAFASLSLCLAAFLTIVDHYDKRPNEHHYQFFKSLCYKATLYLFIAAPFVELFEFILLHNGIDVFPDFHGFADKFTFYSPELHQYLSYIDPLIDMSLVVAGVAFVFIGVGLVLMKYIQGVAKWFGFLFGALGFLGISFFFFAFTINDFLLGEIESNGVIYRAINEPAKFNAILLMHFVVGIFMLLLSIVGVVGMITQRKFVYLR